MSKLKSASLIAAGAAGGALLTVGITAFALTITDETQNELRTFSNVFGAVRKFYVEPVSDKKLTAAAINGMLSDLDAHSAYLDAQEFKSLQENTAGEFGGLGIEIGTEAGFIKVQTPYEGTPADRAGLKAGDFIVKIGDKSTKGMTTSDAAKLMRGKPGTSVTISVTKLGDPVPQVVTIVRDVIKIQSVRSKLLDNGVAYLRITQFQDCTVQDLSKHLNRLGAAQAPKHIILDLRNNPGGLLSGAVGVTAAFIERDQLVVTSRGRQNENTRAYRTLPQFYASNCPQQTEPMPAWAKTAPLAVLINGGSASASEIVAGALKDYNRAKLIGIRSFGKGSVQNVINLPNGDGIKLTIARYYTPKDISIQAKGIEPDFAVDETAEGNVFADLFQRESDSDKALDNAGAKKKTPEEIAKEQQERMQKLELLRAQGRKPVEFGSAEDFQLQQTLLYFQGKPLQLSKAKDAKADK